MCAPMIDLSSQAGTGVEVNALAAIGRAQCLLVVRQSGNPCWSLPGVPVVPGRPVENGLRRVVRAKFGASVAFVSFVAAVEHGYADQSGALHHELNLVFDAGLVDPEVRCLDVNLTLRWVSSSDLRTLELTPPGLRDGLLSGRFDEGDRWLPWRPESQSPRGVGQP